MTVGDLVMQLRESIRARWGVGYIVEVHESGYENNIPFVTVIWPLLNMETTGSQVYLEVLK
tara:strand:- start:94 stop:276 length:183 start_codon:yes stop_codon:yes gene_type:complete